jgi:AcrR family transcriptional regulator
VNRKTATPQARQAPTPPQPPTASTGATAPRGRPRSEQAHHAILQAAADLLLEQGLAEVSMDAVAARAGVSKATIYRWWPTKEALALDALYHEWQNVPPPRDTGTLRGDLLSLLRPWARLAAQRPYGRVLAALATEARSDTAFAQQYIARFVEPRRDQARAIFRRAIDRGELLPGTKIEVALDLIYGPVYHRLLHGHAPLTDTFVRDIVDTALSGITPRSSQTGPGNRPPGHAPGKTL